MTTDKGLSILCAVLACACSSSGTGGGPGGGAAGAATGGSGGLGGTSGAGGVSTGGNAGSRRATGNPVIEVDTSMGKMVIELDAVNMPATTKNFLEYVDAGFYTGTIFHRVIPDFVIQGGGFGSGLTPKQTNPPIALETSPQILHDYGVISMARTNEPNSATSQFFLVNAKAGSHSLDDSYAAFGRMKEGDTVLDAISAVPTQSSGSYKDVPVTEVVVNGISRK